MLPPAVFCLRVFIHRVFARHCHDHSVFNERHLIRIGSMDIMATGKVGGGGVVWGGGGVKGDHVTESFGLI